MSSPICSLAYFSRNAIAGTVDELNCEIASILHSARRNNPARNVTGALLYSDGCFAQVLEGRREDVEHIFENIQCDLRHSGVTVMHFHDVGERSFGEWSMAFAGIVGVSMEATVTGAGMVEPDDIMSTEAGKNLLLALRNVVYRDDLGRRVERGIG